MLLKDLLSVIKHDTAVTVFVWDKDSYYAIRPNIRPATVKMNYKHLMDARVMQLEDKNFNLDSLRIDVRRPA